MNLIPQNGDILVLGVLDNSGYGTNFLQNTILSTPLIGIAKSSFNPLIT
jgi:hypothetical protein